MHLDGLACSPIGLLNVYGPYSSVERIQLWKTILLSIDASRLWIIGGGWNFVESVADQFGRVLEDLSREEVVH